MSVKCGSCGAPLPGREYECEACLYGQPPSTHYSPEAEYEQGKHDATQRIIEYAKERAAAWKREGADLMEHGQSRDYYWFMGLADALDRGEHEKGA